MTLSRWGVEGFHIIQKKIVGTRPSIEKLDNGNVLPKIVPGELDAVENLLNQFHKSYRDNDIFDSLTATLTLDVFAILFMVFIMIVCVFKSLKSNDSH